MKNVYFILTLILTFALLLIPLLAVENPKTEKSPNLSSSGAIPPAAQTGSDFFLLYDKGTEKTEKLSRKDYLLGVLAAEMPASYENEALKAQAVAAYTFALYRKAQNKGVDYDISNDHTVDQSYLNAAQRQEKWGDQAKTYEEKLLQCIEAVNGVALFYQNEPILAAYHAISGGNTESAEVIWGKAYPYLVPKISTGDLLSPDYLTEVTLNCEDFAAKLKTLECNPQGDAATYIGEAVKSESGTVREITLCGTKVNGTKVREVFGLKSANFELTYKNNTFIFTVKGYGHGVGMSQYGANYMAQQGSGYEDILKSYYTDCSLQKTK